MVEVSEADEKVRREEEMRVKVTAVLGIFVLVDKMVDNGIVDLVIVPGQSTFPLLFSPRVLLHSKKDKDSRER